MCGNFVDMYQAQRKLGAKTIGVNARLGGSNTTLGKKKRKKAKAKIDPDAPIIQEPTGILDPSTGQRG